MNEKELIELLKKPQVRAALKEITLPFQAVNIPTRKNALQIHETFVDMLRRDNQLYQEVLDEWRENPSSFSPFHKYSYGLHRAALWLYSLKLSNFIF